MADLEQLKQKYAGVISIYPGVSDDGAKTTEFVLDGDKLLLKASVPSTVVANRVWDEIKKTDPTYSDLHHEIGTSGGPEQPYTIKSGDNLSHISQRFYGAASKYTKIAEANGMSDPNKIQVGQTINLSVL